MSDPRFSAKRESEHLLVIEGSGRLDAVSMEVALDMLVREMDGMHHAGILMRDQGFEWPTLAAIGVELRHWGQMMAMVQKIDRVALVSSSPLIRGAALVESALIPNLTIRNFDPDQEKAARAWLAEGVAGRSGNPA